MKKAEAHLLWVIIGIIVAILIILPLFNISLAFFSKQDTTPKNFDYLVNVIKNQNINEEVRLLFVFNEDYFLIGFKKDEEFIGDENKKCGDFKFKDKIRKPEDCSGKSCLCLCKGKELSSDLCTNEKDLCMPFNNVDIIDDQNPCSYFILNKNSNLVIKKQQGIININKEQKD